MEGGCLYNSLVDNKLVSGLIPLHLETFSRRFPNVTLAIPLDIQTLFFHMPGMNQTVINVYLTIFSSRQFVISHQG